MWAWQHLHRGPHREAAFEQAEQCKLPGGAEHGSAPSACRGKLLNVRDASALQITNNTEIQNIKQIMGLQHGKVRCVHGDNTR